MASDQSADSLSSLRAVERVCNILDLLQEASEGLTLTDIADRTGLPKSTAHRYLVALETRAYVGRDEHNVLRLGAAFRPPVTRQLEQFLIRARPILLGLRNATNETVNLGVLDGRQLSHVIVIESEQMMRLAARVGEQGMIHSTAMGKAIAANLEPEVVRAMLETEGMPAMTDSTCTNADDYFAELEQVRRVGFGLDDCENQDDGRCIAVAVEHMPIPCAVSISAPMRRFPKNRIPEFVELLRAAAAELASQYAEFAQQQPVGARVHAR